jgi:hypothetical protein
MCDINRPPESAQTERLSYRHIAPKLSRMLIYFNGTAATNVTSSNVPASRHLTIKYAWSILIWQKHLNMTKTNDLYSQYPNFHTV